MKAEHSPTAFLLCRHHPSPRYPILFVLFLAVSSIKKNASNIKRLVTSDRIAPLTLAPPVGSSPQVTPAPVALTSSIVFVATIEDIVRRTVVPTTGTTRTSQIT